VVLENTSASGVDLSLERAHLEITGHFTPWLRGTRQSKPAQYQWPKVQYVPEPPRLRGQSHPYVKLYCLSENRAFIDLILPTRIDKGPELLVSPHVIIGVLIDED
jgi:hypothetical protein